MNNSSGWIRILKVEGPSAHAHSVRGVPVIGGGWPSTGGIRRSKEYLKLSEKTRKCTAPCIFSCNQKFSTCHAVILRTLQPCQQISCNFCALQRIFQLHEHKQKNYLHENSFITLSASYVLSILAYILNLIIQTDEGDQKDIIGSKFVA